MNNTTQHVVMPGDNLYAIANMYNTTVEEIMKLNQMSSTNIYPNQVLMIPYISTDGIKYNEYLTVPGDTLEIIEEKSGVDLDTLNEYNEFDKLLLVPKQSINIPVSEPKVYVILDEDELDVILEKTGLTERELILLNRNEWLRIGSNIIIG